MYKPVDKAFQKIGNKHTYQKLLVVYLFIMAGFVNYLLVGPTFIFMNPLFQCNFSEELVDQSIACSRLDECSIASNFTIVSKMGLYCQGGQFDRSIIQAISAIGSVVGLFVINITSDVKGRKIAMIFTLSVAALSILLTLIGAFANSVALEIFSQFCCGFSGYSMIIMVYLYPSELTEDVFRQKTLIVVSYAWSLTSALLGVLFYLEIQWYNYLTLFVLIPMLGVLLISLFFLVQGPNFLYGNKKQKQCLKSLQTVAIINNKVKQFQEVKFAFRFESNEEQQKHASPLEAVKLIFKDAYYRKTTIILIFLDMGGTLYYMATNFALDQIGYDYGANMISTGLIEFCAYLFLHAKVDKIPRRKGILIINSVMVVFGMLFFIPPIKNNKLVAFVIIGILRFFGTMSWTLVMMLLTESYPLQIQATCVGVVESITQIGSFMAPIIITASIDMQIYPIIILSFIVVLMIVIPIYFFEERKIIEEAEKSLEDGESLCLKN